MLRLPFINRKRYIVLKAYTWNKFWHEYAPIQNSVKDENPKSKREIKRTENTFRYCYARTYGATKSATLLSPCSFEINVGFDKNDELKANFNTSINADWISVSFDHNDDPHYLCKDTIITKIAMPWLLYEETATPFVLARHLQNKSPMMIPTGMVHYKTTHQLNVFNHILAAPHFYEVPFQHPILQFFPLSDLPLHVESYHDPQRYEELEHMNGAIPYFVNWKAKLDKKIGIK